MPRRAVPALLALTAFLADLSGAHQFALAVLFVAIPAGFALLVTCHADRGGSRTLFAGVGLMLLVVSASLRSPALVGGVPRLAVSALALAPIPCLYAALRIMRQPARADQIVEEDELRRAA